MDGDVNFKIGVLMMSMFCGGFIGSNIAGYLIDRFKKFKVIGICAISIGIAAFVAFEYVMIHGYPIWVIIITGAIFVTCLGMTLPIYFNLGGELIFPIGEAHGQDFYRFIKLNVVRNNYCK